MPRKILSRGIAPMLAALPLCLASAAHGETRGYVISWFATATHNNDLKEACPEDRNGGVVEFHIRELVELGYTKEQATDLVRTSPNPTSRPPGFEDKVVNRLTINGKPGSIYSYPEATKDPNIETVVGKYAWGFDLGSKNQGTKFEDPDTHQKVDNQLWRAVGCTGSFLAAPPAMPYPEDVAWNLAVDTSPAWTIQVTGEDLSKDGKVTLTMDRATQHLERDAAAGVLAGSTYVIEPTQRSHNVIQGEIKDGVLTITPQYVYLEGEMPHYAEIALNNSHMRLKLQPDGKLLGYWGGTLDWTRWVYMFTGRPGNNADTIGIYWALKKFADFDPDPQTGQNRQISTTFRLEAVPAFLANPKGDIVASPAGVNGKGVVEKVADNAAK